jgi:hypothetical protein
VCYEREMNLAVWKSAGVCTFSEAETPESMASQRSSKGETASIDPSSCHSVRLAPDAKVESVSGSDQIF